MNPQVLGTPRDRGNSRTFTPDTAYKTPLNPVKRTAADTVWAGRMAVGGLVEARITTASGQLLSLTQSVIVAPRTFPVMKFPGPPLRRVRMGDFDRVGTVISIPGLPSFGVPARAETLATLGTTPDAALVDRQLLDPADLLSEIVGDGPNAGYAILKQPPPLARPEVRLYPALEGEDPTDPWLLDQNGVDGRGRIVAPGANIRYCTQLDVIGPVRRYIEAHEGLGVTAASPTSHIGRWIEVFTGLAPAQRYERLALPSRISTEDFRTRLFTQWEAFRQQARPYVNKALDDSIHPAGKMYQAFGCALDLDINDKEQ